MIDISNTDIAFFLGGLTLIGFILGQIKWVYSMFEAQAKTFTEKTSALQVQLETKLIAAQAEFKLSLENSLTKEQTVRHDMRNEIQNLISTLEGNTRREREVLARALEQLQREAVRQTSLDAIEKRMEGRHDKLEGRMDKLSEQMTEISAMKPTMLRLLSHMERSLVPPSASPMQTGD